MTYTVTILRRAQKELSALPQDVYVHIRESIWKLADEPRPSGSRKLAGRSWVANSLMPESLELNFDNIERRPLHEFSKPGWNEMESGMFRRTESPVFRYATYGLQWFLPDWITNP